MRLDAGARRVFLPNREFEVTERLAHFIALLDYDRAYDMQTAVTQERAVMALMPAHRGSRAAMGRILEQAIHKFGSENPISFTHKTTGPWYLNRKIEIYFDGVPAKKSRIGGLFEFDNPASPEVEMLPEINPSHIEKLIKGDIAFSHGKLSRAENFYSQLDHERFDTIYRAIAISRLITTYKRAENYSSMRSCSRRLSSLSARMGYRGLSGYFSAFSALSNAWYSYSFDKNYDKCMKTLLRTQADCGQHSDLWIDWLNLYALTVRRFALECEGDEKEDYALQSISYLKAGMFNAIAVNRPYGMQQSIANLSHLWGLFADPKHGILEPPRGFAISALQLLGLSIKICENFGIGKDDMFNAIFLLSTARKHNIKAGDHALSSANIPILSDSLATYGADEYWRLEADNKVSAEQRVFLLLELIRAALVEERLPLANDCVDALRGVLIAQKGNATTFVARELSAIAKHIRKLPRAPGKLELTQNIDQLITETK